jgi:hypothetical protein
MNPGGSDRAHSAVFKDTDEPTPFLDRRLRSDRDNVIYEDAFRCAVGACSSAHPEE